ANSTITMSPVATSDAAFRGGACPTPEYTIAYTGNYTTSADASLPPGSSARHQSLRQPGPEDPVKAFVPSMLASCHQQEV
ncbi:hypothetical protein, partial [Novosphingobium aerophilum]|uniref:hypothetical protein n=1 Tax=Novosphingobium aerophilum TaxID=2839843 RepID=UPI001BE4A122